MGWNWNPRIQMAEQTPVSFLENVSSGKQNRDGRSCYPQLPSKPIWCLRSQQNIITPMASLHDWWPPMPLLRNSFHFFACQNWKRDFLSTQSSESSGSTIPSWFGPPADWVSRLPWANWQNSPFTGEHWNWLVTWFGGLNGPPTKRPGWTVEGVKFPLGKVIFP